MGLIIQDKFVVLQRIETPDLSSALRTRKMHINPPASSRHSITTTIALHVLGHRDPPHPVKKKHHFTLQSLEEAPQPQATKEVPKEVPKQPIQRHQNTIEDTAKRIQQPSDQSNERIQQRANGRSKQRHDVAERVCPASAGVITARSTNSY